MNLVEIDKCGYVWCSLTGISAQVRHSMVFILIIIYDIIVYYYSNNILLSFDI